MTGVDYAILAIVLVSALIGLWRGFVREALSLAIWVLAFWAAYSLAAVIEVYFAAWLTDSALRTAVAFVVIFLLIHIVGFVVSRLLSKLVKAVGLRSVDRVAGAGFGLVRALVVVAVTVLLVNLTPLSNEPAWQGSYLVALTGQLLAWLQARYPMLNNMSVAGLSA